MWKYNSNLKVSTNEPSDTDKISFLFYKDEALQTPKYMKRHDSIFMKLKIGNVMKFQGKKYQDSIFSVSNK